MNLNTLLTTWSFVLIIPALISWELTQIYITLSCEIVGTKYGSSLGITSFPWSMLKQIN